MKRVVVTVDDKSPMGSHGCELITVRVYGDRGEEYGYEKALPFDFFGSHFRRIMEVAVIEIEELHERNRSMSLEEVEKELEKL